jgi:hypothetical protein
MAKSRNVYLMIIILAVIVSCSSKQSTFFDDDNFHFALYVDPTSDCVDCTLKALRALSNSISKDDPIHIFIKRNDDAESFFTFLRSEFPSKEIKRFDHDLKVPHPSIVMIKKRSIYMYLFILNDPFLFDQFINQCLQLFSNFK